VTTPGTPEPQMVRRSFACRVKILNHHFQDSAPLKVCVAMLT
jgi:hypothetical protein